MKTHLKQTLRIVALTTLLSLPCHAALARDLLADRAKLEGAKSAAEAAATANPETSALQTVAADKAKDLADFDALHVKRFGADWLTRWQNSSYEDADDEAADIYMNGNLFVWPNANYMSPAKRAELIAHLATKPVLENEDMEMVRNCATYNVTMAGRLDELAVLLKTKGAHGEEYYRFKHRSVLAIPWAWHKSMTVETWFDLASANTHFSPDAFVAMRDYVLAAAAKKLIDKRRAAGLSIEGPEFDTAFAPVLSAIKTPMFGGLPAAVNSLGLDLAIPTPDFTAQQAIAATVADAAVRRATFITPQGSPTLYPDGLGSVMFVMGENAYRNWQQGLTNN